MLMFAVVYFLMIRPQMQKVKQEKSFVDSLKKGNRVITKGGIHGKVLEVNITNATVVLETTAGKLTFELASISSELSQKLTAKKQVDKKEA